VQWRQRAQVPRQPPGLERAPVQLMEEARPLVRHHSLQEPGLPPEPARAPGQQQARVVATAPATSSEPAPAENLHILEPYLVRAVRRAQGLVAAH
jgi:hypothetical protein